MQEIYEEDRELKLVDSQVCPIITDWDTYCKTRLELDTGTIQK